MRSGTFLFALVAALCLYLGAASNVLELDGENFKSTIDAHEFVLVEFFAPWCGHCKALAPEYEKAADTLADSAVKLAKVDCTKHATLCSQYEVRGYPTLKFFKSQVPKEYNGPREAKGIVDWLKSKSGPAYHTLATEEEVKAFTAEREDSVYLLGHYDDAEAAKPFLAVANDPKAESWALGYVTAAGVGTKNTVVLHRGFDADVVFDKATFTTDELVDWASEHAYPYVGEVSAQYERIAKRNLPITLVFLDDEPAEELEKVLTWLNPVAKAQYQIASYAYVGKAFHPRLSQLGASGEKVPTAVVLDSTGKRWPFDETQEFNAETLAKHVAGVVDGSIKPHFKSEPIPEEDNEPVKTIVGKSFESIVLDPTKTVLVEFYAPWCGHCKSLVPVYNQVGEHYKDSKDVVIAKIDSTANDNPVVVIKGFPTIYVFPAGDKTGVEYNGARTAEGLIEFVESHKGATQEGEAGEEDHHDEHDHDHHGHDHAHGHSHDEL